MGYLFIFLIILAIGGWQVAGPILKNVAAGVMDFLKWMGYMAIHFPNEIGLTDAIHTRILYWIILCVPAALGIGVSVKTKKALFGICGSFISILSLPMTLAA